MRENFGRIGCISLLLSYQRRQRILTRTNFVRRQEGAPRPRKHAFARSEWRLSGKFSVLLASSPSSSSCRYSLATDSPDILAVHGAPTELAAAPRATRRANGQEGTSSGGTETRGGNAIACPVQFTPAPSACGRRACHWDVPPRPPCPPLSWPRAPPRPSPPPSWRPRPPWPWPEAFASARKGRGSSGSCARCTTNSLAR